MNEQPKNQQPAAAPIDIEARFIAEHGHRLAQLLRIDAFDIADRDAQIMAALKNEHTPAPGDERAAYHFHRFVNGVEMAEGVLIERAPTLEAAIKEAVRCCEKRPMTVLVHAPAWAGTLCGGALANRAASANETGAEVAQWQARLKDRSSPVVDRWVNISPDGAKTLMEKYAGVYEVRALSVVPQPAQADAPAEPRELPMMRKAFRVTEVSGDPDPAKQRFYMRFSFPSIEALHAADDEWRKFVAAPVSAPAYAGEARLTDEQRSVIATLLEGDVLSTDEDAVLRELLNGADHA